MKRIKICSMALALMLIVFAQVWAAPIAGHVILTKGSVTATADDGSSRALKRRSEIFNGDVIKTGPAGSVQIRFIDKALMTIKANSEMNMETYLLAQEGTDAQKEQVLMSLVKGGFRTITGTIGKGDKSAYKVNTPAASIGIRGTNYEVQQEGDGGFVMGVYSGGITVENEAGTLELGEGADFNFTRVKPKSSPKGLLAPPQALGENTATEQNDEESVTEEGADDGTDDGKSEDDSPLAEGESDGNDDGSPTTANVADSNTTDVEGNTNQAIDKKVNTTLEKEKDEFVESGGADQLILDELIKAGILDNNQTLDDLNAEIFDLVQSWIANPSDIATLIAKIQDLYDQQLASTFDFTDPFINVNPNAASSPFTTDVITDQQYALADTGKLAVMAIPVNASTNYAGDSPSIQTLEAQLTSPETINSGSFVGFDYTNANTYLRLRYELINITTGDKDKYEIEILLDANITTIDDLESHLYTALTEYDVYNLNGQQVSGGSAPGHVAVSYNPITERFEFNPATDSNSFIVEMEINADNGNTESLALLAQLGNGSSTDNFWEADAGLDMVLGNGTWDTTNDRPVLVLKNSNSHDDGSGNTITEDRIEVVKKPIDAGSTVSSLGGFAACVNSSLTCDIQVNTVAAADNIRWGAWLTEPGKGIQITEFNINQSTTNTDSEEQILAFWIAAERADINQLVGNATFSTTSDCAKFGQCIGFADDGIVQNLSANFDVNFTSGAITNGNLKIETTVDPDLGLAGGTGAIESTWDVNFSGQMSTDGNTKLPEFQTQSLSGSVVESTGSSTSIIGEIGGIFVKPGDVFAGGYNLGTADGTNKHTAGVFTMEKQP